MTKLRMGIVGCGERGVTNLGASKRSRHVLTSMVMDTNESLARGLGQKAGVAWTTDFEDLISSPDVDFLFLATPHHIHAEQAIAALEAGKHVLVEKPLANDYASAKRMVDAARASNKELSCWLGFRYFPMVQKAKQIFEQNLLGDIQGAYLSLQIMKPLSYYETGYAGLSKSDWRSRWDSSGGGVFIMNLLHYVDWIPYLTRLRIKTVSATHETFLNNAEVEDSVALWARLENGAIVSAHACACVQGFHKNSLAEFRVWGTEGHVSLSEPAQIFLTKPFESAKPEHWSKLKNLPRAADGNTEVLNRFAGPILKGERPEITAEEALDLQAVCEALYVSAKEGRPVDVEYSQ